MTILICQCVIHYVVLPAIFFWPKKGEKQITK